MSDLDEYIAAVVADFEKGQTDPQGVAAGQYEGIFVEGPARLQPLDGESEKHHGGYLIGHLIRWMYTRGRPLLTILGPTMYAAAIAHVQAQEALTKDDGVFRAHLYAARTAEHRVASPLSESDERMVFAWLCERADVRLTHGMVDRLERLRVKRHERFGPIP